VSEKEIVIMRVISLLDSAQALMERANSYIDVDFGNYSSEYGNINCAIYEVAQVTIWLKERMQEQPQ